MLLHVHSTVESAEERVGISLERRITTYIEKRVKDDGVRENVDFLHVFENAWNTTEKHQPFGRRTRHSKSHQIGLLVGHVRLENAGIAERT